MRQTIRLGRFAGIPVGVHWTVLVIMALLAQGLAVGFLPAGAPGHPAALYWAVAVVVTALFMAALLAHELAHAMVARHYGIRVRGITLWLLGGVSELDGLPPHARGELLVAVAGPLVSLAGGLGCAVVAVTAGALGAGRLAVAALAWLAVVNGALAVFNLLPGAPLDGGRILAAAVWWLRGDRAAGHRVAARAGIVLGLLLITAGLAELLVLTNLSGAWLVLLGWFLVSAARAENADVVLRSALTGVRVGQAMSAGPVFGYETQSVQNFIDTVARRRPYRFFPVLGLDGRVTGLVGLDRLSRVPVAGRGGVRLRQVQVPLDRIVLLDPAQPLAEAAPAVLASGHRLALVAVNGRLCGVLSAGDIARAMELAALGVGPDRSDTALAGFAHRAHHPRDGATSAP